MVFNKLVRDNIPDLMEANGQLPVVRVLDDEDYTLCLEKKLDDEVAEFHRDKNIEELADILEVVFALTENLGASREELMEVYRGKNEARGGFSKRLFLVSKENSRL